MSGASEDEAIREVVIDTTVLSNYAAVDWHTDESAMEFLANTFTIPSTVLAVREELEDGVEDNPHLVYALDHLGIEDRSEESAEESPPYDGRIGLHPMSSSEAFDILDYGERRVLSSARYRGCAIATDDKDARDLAHKYDIPCTGSIGIVVRGVDRGEVSVEQADRWHDVWVSHCDFYSPIESISAYLAQR